MPLLALLLLALSSSRALNFLDINKLSTIPSQQAVMASAPQDRTVTIGSNEGLGVFPTIEFEKHWQVLGPWQIGTREAAWGADPTHFYGGFHSLTYDPSTRFASSLAFNGTIGWTRRYLQIQESQDPKVIEIPIKIGFPDVDFESLRSVYGWAGTQFQAWVRSDFIVNGTHSQRVLLYTDGIMEFRVDDKHYFGGDFFSFRNAPTALWLEPGQHRIEIRLIRDVRSMGGNGTPQIDCHLSLTMLGSIPGPLAVEQGVVPDFLEGRGLAGRYASIKVRNDYHREVCIVSVTSRSAKIEVNALQGTTATMLATGQTREMPLHISAPHCDGFNASAPLEIEIRFTTEVCSEHEKVASSTLAFTTRKIGDAHKMTYLHPSGAVSYAIIEPPTVSNVTEGNAEAPVLLNLHGAGLEVDSDEVRRLFIDLKPFEFWVVHPSGMTSWSGDDWHSWGFADAEAAIKAIIEWIKAVKWTGPGVNPESFYVLGHSNGGQGTWYALTHRPQKVIAAAAVSGYTSIEAYVPYHFWSPMDPGAAMVLDAARLSYRHELLADNFVGIPVTQQHRSSDDNVPPFHSRNMYQLAFQSKIEPKFFEIPGKGHWYEGVLETDHLKTFYRSVKKTKKTAGVPKEFKLVATPNGEAGSRGAVRIENLIVPHGLGKLDFNLHQTNDKWMLNLTTTNVRCLSIDIAAMSTGLEALHIDSQIVQTKLSLSHEEGQLDGRVALVTEPHYYVQDDEGRWTSYESTGAPLPRRRDQLGGMDALLRASEAIHIAQYHPGQSHIADQISHNLYQYFRADSKITRSNRFKTSEATKDVEVHLLDGEMSTFLDPGTAHPGFLLDEYESDLLHPIRFVGGGVQLSFAGGTTRWYRQAPGMALYFLAPGRSGRLELIVWGYELEDLQKIVRLLPTTTGVGQPDFVILGEESAWKGAGGVKAMGYFDHAWKVAAGSFVT